MNLYTDSAIGITALSLSKLRRTPVFYKTEKNTHLKQNWLSIACPIYNQFDQIVGYVGMFLQEWIHPTPAITFLELLSKFISNSLSNWKNPINISDEQVKRLFLLSRREKEVLRLIGQGLSDSEISKSQHISLSTVRAHVRNIFLKLKVDKRTKLILFYLASEALGLYTESKEKFNDS
ncbi:response regulator transcription factor [Brevibacillus brevis]|uniref:response regulator transcription factor n=1 Tax=Brevibacillus brevis TaxID=1393 RepID=UPI0012DD273F|nr:LuxR C-terminal-related transcriptional regulator [Brevibacillus brevis]UIO40939.1 LuxR C-terminal-related transcriptional regulator [Brevibacillus brevis]